MALDDKELKLVEAVEKALADAGYAVTKDQARREHLNAMLATYARNNDANRQTILTPSERSTLIDVYSMAREEIAEKNAGWISEAAVFGYEGCNEIPDIDLIKDALAIGIKYLPIPHDDERDRLTGAMLILSLAATPVLMQREDMTSALISGRLRRDVELLYNFICESADPTREQQELADKLIAIARVEASDLDNRQNWNREEVPAIVEYCDDNTESPRA